MGSFALASNIHGLANVAIGDAALNNADTNFNTAVRFNAGQNISCDNQSPRRIAGGCFVLVEAGESICGEHG
jgi:hypothetical protein